MKSADRPSRSARSPITPSPTRGTGHHRRRAVVEAVRPEVDGGRFPIKRTVGEEVVVTADVFADGHDQVAAVAALPGGRLADRRVARGADDADRQRSVDGALHGRDARPLPSTPCRPGSTTSRRGGGALEEVRRRAGRDERARRGRRDDPPHGGGDRPPPSAGAGRRPTPRRRTGRGVADRARGDGRRRRGRVAAGGGGARRGSGGGDACARPARRGGHLRPDARGGRRADARTGGRVVRDVPALRGAGPLAQRHVRRGGGAAAGHRRHGLRRRLPSARASDRAELPQGAQQRPGRGAGRSGQPVGHRQRRKAVTRRSSRGSARSRTSTASSPRRDGWASRWRSTSPSRRRPTTPTCASTPSGSATVRTARSSTRRTRRRSTRTSTRSTSSRPTWRRSGRS